MNIYGLTRGELSEYFAKLGENPAKASIIFDAVYKKGITDFGELGFSERVTLRLREDFSFESLKTVEKSLSQGDNAAAKLLLRLQDGEFVETVLMRQRFGNCVCVSTQVGCNMACKFCQSGLTKKRRDLTAGEIMGQVLAIMREFSCRVDGVSVMGIGEPFDNFAECVKFCEIVTDDKGLAVGRRHTTVSTCGIVPKIREFAKMRLPVNLAVSLHASNDELRNELMPINKKYPINEVLDAAEYFSEETGRRITLEYIMLSGVNDLPEHAKELAGLIGKRNFYVNLIPYNSTESDFVKSSAERISAFCAVLKENGIVATKRREFGADLNAACGQLRAEHIKKNT